MSGWIRGPLLGRGSNATVFLASDPVSGDLFAVKSPNTNLSCSKSFDSEKSIHSSLSSPHVISYLGHDSDNNLFLEYASGGSISDHIKKQKLPESKIRSFVRDVLLGLSHLHSLKIAHCDIKPKNILICSDGRAKIADLGCAKYVNSDDRNKGESRGTPMFMAPEVARGEEQGLASDVWALGCTIVEMATGRAPWTNVSDAGSLLYRVGYTDEVPKLPEWVSDAGKDFMRRCLVKDAGKRRSVDELLKHPFVSDLDMGVDAGCTWITPKSVLDNSIWDSEPEKEERDIGSGSNRISDLVGEGPDWSWDDSWQIVRDESMSSENHTSYSSTGATVVDNFDRIDIDDTEPELYGSVHVSLDKSREEAEISSECCTSDEHVALIIIVNRIFDLIACLMIVRRFKILYASSFSMLQKIRQLRLKTNQVGESNRNRSGRVSLYMAEN